MIGQPSLKAKRPKFLPDAETIIALATNREQLDEATRLIAEYKQALGVDETLERAAQLKAEASDKVKEAEAALTVASAQANGIKAKAEEVLAAAHSEISEMMASAEEGARREIRKRDEAKAECAEYTARIEQLRAEIDQREQAVAALEQNAHAIMDKAKAEADRWSVVAKNIAALVRGDTSSAGG